MGLDAVANKPVKLFSGGMKRRVNLAIGVMNDQNPVPGRTNGGRGCAIEMPSFHS